MKRFALRLALVIGVGTLSFAQEDNKHNIEVGVGASGLSTFLVGGPGRNIGIGLHTEYRSDYSKYINFATKVYFMHSKCDSGASSIGPTKYFNSNQIGIKTGVDLNILPSKRVCPYVGLAVGGGINTEGGLDRTHTTSDIYGTVGSRIGVQIGPIRTSFESDLFFDGGHHFSLDGMFLALNVGYTF